jgi:hypothetical protein
MLRGIFRVLLFAQSNPRGLTMARSASNTISVNSLKKVPNTNIVGPGTTRRGESSALPLGDSALPFPLRNAANGVPRITNGKTRQVANSIPTMDTKTF